MTAVVSLTQVNGSTPPQHVTAPVLSGHVTAPQQPNRPAVQPRRRRRLPNLHDQSFLGAAFYCGVLLVAGVGSTAAAMVWLEAEWWMAAFAVMLVETGGVYLLVMADARRQLGEQALAARILSASVAAGAVALNWFGHHDQVIQAGFFAGMSALGYLVWLIQSGHRRRDQLRADGKLSQPPPVYGPAQWLAHPISTRQARELARRDPTLGRDGSLEARRLQKGLGAYFRQQLVAANDPKAAEALLAIFDPSVMASTLRKLVDFEGYAEAMARNLDPRRVLNPNAKSSPLPRVDMAKVASGVIRARVAAGRTVAARPDGRVRRPKAETYALYEQLVRDKPGLTELEYAALLGISDSSLRAAKRAQQGSQP